jgi:hypothetical protein
MSMKLRESAMPTAQLAGPSAQLMMTLSAFASIDEAALPGEWGLVQEQVILSDLVPALRESTITASWAPVWVGLSASGGANMAYIAQNKSDTSQYAVVIRGTDFAMLVDLLEDLCVQETESFTPGSDTVRIAQGTSVAQRLLAAAVGTNLHTMLQELTSRVGADGAGSTIFVTGHSLGGALATTVALYLHNALPDASFQVYTFAAPTAGLADFADLFASTFPGNDPGANSSWRVHNAWDVVPQAWQPDTLQAILSWYPSPGPAQTYLVHQIIEGITELPGTLHYQQPSVNVCQLNDLPWAQALKDPQAVHKTLDDFITQNGFQHDCNTYLQLLDAPTVAAVYGLSPNTLHQDTASAPVTLSGLGFTADTTVSFSNPGVRTDSIVCTSQGQLMLNVSVASDAPPGPCNVTVCATAGGSIPGGKAAFAVLSSS